MKRAFGEFVAESLRSNSLRVDCAGTSERALQLVADHCYDAILCDLNLESESGRKVSGFEIYDRICENLRARSQAQPFFVFMSGDLMDSADGEHASQERRRFLQKPFRIADLLSLLNEALCRSCKARIAPHKFIYLTGTNAAPAGLHLPSSFTKIRSTDASSVTTILPLASGALKPCDRSRVPRFRRLPST